MIVGICGVSSSGKSTVVEMLKNKLDAKYINFDDYYISSSEISDKNISWESPYHYRYDEFVDDLSRVKTTGKNGLVIVEGFVIFYDKKARDLFDRKIFLELPEEEMIKRRLSRKRWVEEDTLEYLNGEFIRGHREFVYPQKQYADLVLDGLEPPERLVEQVLKFVEQN